MVGVMMGNEDMGYLDVVLSDAFEQGLEDAIGVDEYAVAVRAVCEEVCVREPPGMLDAVDDHVNLMTLRIPS